MNKYHKAGVLVSVSLLASPQCEAAPWLQSINAFRRWMTSRLNEDKDDPRLTEQAQVDQVSPPDTTVSDLGAVLVVLSLAVLAFWGMHKLHQRKRKAG
jgi:hypothetical protein